MAETNPETTAPVTTPMPKQAAGLPRISGTTSSTERASAGDGIITLAPIRPATAAGFLLVPMIESTSAKSVGTTLSYSLLLTNLRQ